MDEHVRNRTDSYVDDIIVNEQILNSGRVIKLLEMYGLLAKPAEPLV